MVADPIAMLVEKVTRLEERLAVCERNLELSREMARDSATESDEDAAGIGDANIAI